jgi:hypothetical protein
MLVGIGHHAIGRFYLTLIFFPQIINHKPSKIQTLNLFTTLSTSFSLIPALFPFNILRDYYF